MGEAKRRGTFEQRKAEGELKRAAKEEARLKRVADIRARRLATPRGKEIAAYYAASLGALSV